jgi:pantoate--beta-alanine ligase
MGFFHQGHLRLIAEARRDTDLVVVSLFVNPTQFGPSEDFDRYPRDLERDRRLASDTGVDILFMPDMETMYPGGPGSQKLWMDAGDLASHLEGAARPGHFRGVATVVAKLFNLVSPDRAYFGQKDAQQSIIIARMVRDLAFPVEIVVVPTVREPDGLALSSRNVYLSPEQRSQASAISRSLKEARRLLSGGERNPRIVEEAMRELLEREAPLARIDYVAISDLTTLEPVAGTICGDVLISLAVFFDKTRLIDNIVARFRGSEAHFS